jgi:hypothetical protein
LTAVRISNYMDFVKLATVPANPATEEGRFYLKTIDTDNNGIFAIHKQGGILIEEQISPRPYSPFVINDATDATINTPLHGHRITYDQSTTQFVNSPPPPSENSETKPGEFYPLTASTVKSGLLSEGVVELSDATNVATYGEDTKGRWINYSTATATQTNAGVYSTIPRYRREYSSKFYAYWLGQSGTSNTIYTIGLTSSSTLPTGDTPLDASIQGVLVMLRLADNNTPPGTLKIIHNDNTATATVVDTGKSYVGNTTYHKVEIHLSPTDVKVYVDDTYITTLTTKIPLLATPLYPYVLVRRNGGGAKEIKVYKWGVNSK